MKLPVQIYYRIFTISGIISLVITSSILWFQMIRSHELRTGSDFIAFFTAAEIANSKGGYPYIYDINAQYNVQTEVLGFELQDQQILLYNHMPFLVPLLDWLIDKDYVASFGRWALLLIALYGIAIFQITTIFPEHWKRQYIWVTLSLFTFFPFAVSVILGQDTAFLALGVSLLMVGMWKNDNRMAGLGLTVMLIRPHIALIIALPILFRRPRAFAWFSIFSFILAVFSILLISIQGAKDFVNILVISAQGEWHGMNEANMFNILGFLIRMLPEISDDVKRALAWGFFLLSAVFLILVWKNPKNKTVNLLGISILTSLFSVPHLHYHDLTLMVFPLLLYLHKREGMLAALAISGCSLIFLFSQANELLLFNWPYLLGLILFVTLFRNRQTSHRTDGGHDERGNPN